MVDAHVEALVFEDFFLGDLAPVGSATIPPVRSRTWCGTTTPVLVRGRRAFRIGRCSRGVPVDENGAPMDLCV